MHQNDQFDNVGGRHVLIARVRTECGFKGHRFVLVKIKKKLAKTLLKTHSSDHSLLDEA